MDVDLKDGSKLEEAKKTLEAWKAKAEKADDLKARLILEKLEADDTKSNAKQEMMAAVEKQQEFQKYCTQDISRMQDETARLTKRKHDLQEKLRKIQAGLEAKRAESSRLKQKFKVYAPVSDRQLAFTSQKKDEEESEEGDVSDSDSIRGVFTISQRNIVGLEGGQALITFEEEKVASRIVKITKCTVSCESASVDVKPKRIRLDPSVKFEIHLIVSRKELEVLNIPPSMPEERTKDRLEMSFSRPSRGGGEVKTVDYDRKTGAGCVKFLQSGVAERLVLKQKYPVDLDTEVTVKVGPVYRHELRKFQTFCGCLKRTILLADIDDMEDEEDLQDHLEIHFQKPSNHGGEIETIKYISKGKALQAILFEEDMQQE